MKPIHQLTILGFVLLVVCGFTTLSDRLMSIQPPSGGAGCTASANFLARTSGLSGTETTAYQNMICGLVTDGVITGNLSGAAGCGTGSFDGLYVFATNTTTTANLNICGTGLALTAHGSPTFAADRGYTGDASTSYFDTGFNSNTAGGQMALNSATLGACGLTSRTTSQNYVLIGGTDGVHYSYLQPLTSAVFNYDLNDGIFNAFSNANAQGSWIVTRTSSAGLTLYKNGTSVDTPSAPSSGLTNQNIFIMGYNNSTTPIDFEGDQEAYAFFGAGLNSTLVGNTYTRLHTFLAAVGAGAC